MEINILCCGECPFKMNHGAEYYSCYMNTDIVIDKDKLEVVNHECPMQNENITIKLGGDLGPAQSAEKSLHSCVRDDMWRPNSDGTQTCTTCGKRYYHDGNGLLPYQEEMMSKEVEDIVKELKRRKCTSEHLDDNVHDCKGSEAAAINNAGMEAQVEYLLDCGFIVEDMGVEDFSAADEKPS